MARRGKQPEPAVTPGRVVAWRWQGGPGLSVPGLPNRDLTAAELAVWVGTRGRARAFLATGAWDGGAFDVTLLIEDPPRPKG